MALRAGAFPEKLGHSACSQPACAGKDWCITHPIGQRCTDDQPTIKGQTSANFGYSKPLFACVHRTFGDQFIVSARAIFFCHRGRATLLQQNRHKASEAKASNLRQPSGEQRKCMDGRPRPPSTRLNSSRKWSVHSSSRDDVDLRGAWVGPMLGVGTELATDIRASTGDHKRGAIRALF